MKILAALSLLFTFTAHAGSSIDGVFKRDSNLPLELKEKVLETIQNRCSKALVGFKEETTVVTEKSIDQGQSDFYYRTFLTATHYFDGTHPEGVDIVVDSAKYAISNPSVVNSEVLSIRDGSSDSRHCR